MRGAFRGDERVRIREQWSTGVVPSLAASEIAPLIRFFPDQAGLVVLDIGANKGLWTRALLNEFGERVARVHMFDPSPENYRDLTDRADNLAGFTDADYQRISAYQCALGRERGTATLYTNEDGSPLGSLHPHSLPGWGPKMKDIRLSEELTVSVETVDEFLAEHDDPAVAIMKIDTEGHEMDVLHGAERAFTSQRIQVVTFEFGIHQVESRHFFKDYWSFFVDRGFEIYSTTAGDLKHLERYEYRWERFDRNYNFIASRLPVRGGLKPPGSATAGGERPPVDGPPPPPPSNDVPGSQRDLTQRVDDLAMRAHRAAARARRASENPSQSPTVGSANILAELATIVQELTRSRR